MNEEYIKDFYKNVCERLEGDYKIILEEGKKLKEDWVEYETKKWKLDGMMPEIVKTLVENKEMTLEEKILSVYKFICLNYIYDDNVLYFFKRDDSDPENIKYIAVDWYGRITDENWEKNREQHNRRICYEFSRYYAKAINMLIENNENMEAFLLGDKENLHYVTGLAGEEYSLILDLDDFNSIKDLTRLKLGLTLKGIKILHDNSGKFTEALEKFNQNLPEELEKIERAKKSCTNKLEYFYKTVEILSECGLDSQGFCEYVRALVESKDIKVDKIWKEVKSAKEKRYARCLIFELEENMYLVDSIEQTLSRVEINELDKNIFVLNPRENEYQYFGG